MSVITFVILCSFLALGGTSPTTEDVCGNFLQKYKFSPEHLPGIWEIKISRPKNADATTSDVLAGAQVVWLYSLTPVEIVSYAEELRDDFPTVNWNKVKYLWNIVSYNQRSVLKSGEITRFMFVLQIEDGPSGEVTAIPAGDTYYDMKRSGALMKALKYRFKTLKNSLAVQFCERGNENEYILQTGLQNPDETYLQPITMN